MNSLIEIVNIVLPVFLVIGLGYLLGAIGLVGPDASSRLSKLVFYVAGPALLFRSAALTPLSRALDLAAMGSIAAVTALTACAVYLACFRSSPSRPPVPLRLRALRRPSRSEWSSTVSTARSPSSIRRAESTRCSRWRRLCPSVELDPLF